MGKTSIVFYAYYYVTILILVKHKKVCIFYVISNVLNFEIKKKRDCIFVKNGTQRLCKKKSWNNALCAENDEYSELTEKI